MGLFFLKEADVNGHLWSGSMTEIIRMLIKTCHKKVPQSEV